MNSHSEPVAVMRN